MIIQEEMYIRSLKRTRKIDIYVPDDYQTSKKRYPVLIINDGQNAFFDERSYIGKSWGFLQAVKQLNIDVILVAIYCNFKPLKREDEYGPWIMNQDLSREYGTQISWWRRKCLCDISNNAIKTLFRSKLSY